MKAEIVSIGNELLIGETVDTNASFLASRLQLLGIELDWVCQVGDDQSRIVEVLRRAWQRSDLVLTTGGLGPTGDDLTRESIAGMLGEELTIEPGLEDNLRKRFSQWGMEMPLSNLKQACVVASARAIPNSEGTAPGWWVEKDGHRLIAMPGPPREMQQMWNKIIEPELRQGSDSVIVSRTFKTFGLSEAAVGELAFPLFTTDNPVLGVYAKPDGIQLRLKAKAPAQPAAEAMIAQGESNIRKVLGQYIWGTDNETLEGIVGRLLIERGLTLAVMEDYSGGWLTASLTDVPESARFFKGGLAVHTDEARIAFGINSNVISQHGAVSPETARAMAEAARKFLGADIGIGITGLEETKERPMGIVYLGLTDDNGCRVDSRLRGKRRVTTAALFELRKSLLLRSGKNEQRL